MLLVCNNGAKVEASEEAAQVLISSGSFAPATPAKEDAPKQKKAAKRKE